MKLVIVGPGYTPIPPIGWGAVESLVWDYKVFLDKYHPDIKTVIVNVPTPQQIVNKVNEENPDIVHIQYDDHAYLAPHMRCKKVLITSHYAYLTQRETRPSDAYFHRIFPMFVNNTATILALSNQIADTYVKAGVSPDRIIIQHNGANDEIFRYAPTPKYPDRSIYLAKIDYRKRQYVYQDIPNLYFAGNRVEARFRADNPRYLGEWAKPVLYENLTDYANLVLLSDGEAHPLVVCEALIAGLGVVLSECASANLDLTLPFVEIVPNNKLDDIDYVSAAIARNREVAITMRNRIREYGLSTFSWRVCVDKYATYLRSLM